MKKISKLAVCAVSFALSSTLAFADGMVFEPIEIPMVQETPTISQPPQTLPNSNNVSSMPFQSTSTVQNNSGFSNFIDKVKSTDNPEVADMSLKENQKMQSALVDLDSSQVELRQNLQTLQQNYNVVDANYEKYKAERKSLSKNIKAVNKKLKNLDNIKEKIRKNML